MTGIPLRRGQRAAFTLVELMVVVLIIAILVSLVSAAVFKAMEKIPETRTRTEIGEMEAALRIMMADFNLSDPPPSSLTLYSNLSSPPYPPGDPSLAFLQKMFGSNVGAKGTITINWGGASGTTLTGEQCLVFYLGGINNQGFSSNKTNPTPVTGQKTKGPYFPFQTSRLVAGNGGFMVYIDPWQTKSGKWYSTLGGSPYSYFSTQGRSNTYPNTSGYNAAAYNILNAAWQPTGQFTNPNTYQIISAGKDGYFGTAGWNPSSGVPPVPPSNANPAGQPAGDDDQSNFSAGLLGKGQQ